MNVVSIIALTLLLTSLCASPPEVDEGVASRAKPALDLRVIEGVEIRLPARSVKYLRVAPPTKPPLQPMRATMAPVMETAEQLASDEARALKRHDLIFLSATVYDRQVTELRMQAGRKEVRVWSNVDFNHFAGVAELETEDAIYWLVMSLGNDSLQAAAADTQESRRVIPAPERFNATRANYFPAMEQKEALPAEATATLNALHSYYQTHGERLVAAHAQRETERTAKEQMLRENPPAPKDTVIHFWPKQSSNYPTK